jgi:phage shock protein A
MADAIPPQPPSWLEEIRAILAELATHGKRLTERHEALAEAVELFHHDVQTFRTRTEEALEKDASNIRSLAGIAREALASIQSLERIATAHQARLDGHEKRIEDLEK